MFGHRVMLRRYRLDKVLQIGLPDLRRGTPRAATPGRLIRPTPRDLPRASGFAPAVPLGPAPPKHPFGKRRPRLIQSQPRGLPSLSASSSRVRAAQARKQSTTGAHRCRPVKWPGTGRGRPSRHEPAGQVVAVEQRRPARLFPGAVPRSAKGPSGLPLPTIKGSQ